MMRSPVPGLDLSIYLRAFAVLVRNPSIVVIPLLMAVIGVLFGQLFRSTDGGIGAATGGLASLISVLLNLFGLGAACIIADDAWSHARASFDRGWEEARRRAGDIFMAAIGFSLLLAVASYAGLLLGPLALLLAAVVAYFLLWTIPAAAVGGIPGGAAIQASIERVRAAPVVAAITAVAALLVLFLIDGVLQAAVFGWLAPLRITSAFVPLLIGAFFQSIGIGYIALILTKTYTDSAFGTRRW